MQRSVCNNVWILYGLGSFGLTEINPWTSMHLLSNCSRDILTFAQTTVVIQCIGPGAQSIVRCDVFTKMPFLLTNKSVSLFGRFVDKTLWKYVWSHQPCRTYYIRQGETHETNAETSACSVTHAESRSAQITGNTNQTKHKTESSM